MKTLRVLLIIVALLALRPDIGRAHTSGYVYCTNTLTGASTPVPGVLVVVTNVSGTFSNANWTTSPEGFFIFPLGTPGTYVEYINPATLPAGATVTSPAGGIYMFTTTAGSDEFVGSFALNCGSSITSAPPAIQLFKSASTSLTSPGEPVTYTYTVTNSGSQEIEGIVITDDNGTPGFTNDDVIVGTVPVLEPGQSQTFNLTFTLTNSPVQELCVSLCGDKAAKTPPPPKKKPGQKDDKLPCISLPVGTIETTVLPSGDVEVVFTQLNVNDNRYGTGATAATGWTHGHKFNDLVGSDHAEFRFTDAAGNVVLDFYSDYISKASSASFGSGSVAYPSGYGTLGATGGDGKLIVGNASSILYAATSLSDNLQLPQFQSGYFVNSPPETSPNSGISIPAGWNYNNSYTVIVSGSAFGASGFGGVTIPSVHNSPAKVGEGALSPTPCLGCVINTAVATGGVAGGIVTATATAQVCLTNTPTTGCAQLGACTPPYPFSSSNPLTSIAFNESDVLKTAIVSVATACVPNAIEIFYSDEHALLLGVREVQVKTSSGTSVTDYPVTPLTSIPGSAMNPQVGSTITTGDQAGTDLSGRPIYPALFVTDITSNPSNPYAGDWQYGGTPIPPSAVFGTWKAAVKVVDSSAKPPKGKPPVTKVSINPDKDPEKKGDGWDLGPGSDPVPAGLKNEKYGAEIRWDISKLGLQSGHTYRLYFMVHDGDQNKQGGDAGQACAIITIP